MTNINKKCPQCLTPFHSKNKRKKFCTKKCSNAHHRNTPEPKIYKKKCISCKAEFNTKYTQKSFCTEKCRIKNQYTRKVRFCTICLEEITSRSNKYCNKHNIYHKNKSPKKRSCSNCQTDTTGTKNKKYCKECSLKILKNKSSHYQKLAVKIKKIWRRDGKVCLWCQSPEITIDHIVPISKGGSLTDQNNMQPLCHICNVSKGNKEPYNEDGVYDCGRYFESLR